MKHFLALVAALLLAPCLALAQPGPGPGPVPSPWITNGNNTYYNGNQAQVPKGSYSSGSAAGTTTGAYIINGATSGTTTVTVPPVAGTYNFTLPATAGSAGQVLQNGGGATTLWVNTVTYVATVTALRAVPVATAPLYFNVQVPSYYGTLNNCPLYYSWNASDSTADNGGTVINPTGNVGNGRWNATLPAGPVHSCVFGVKPDGSTNNSTQGQRLLDWTHVSGPNWVHFDGLSSAGQTKCINFGTTLAVPEGEIVEGDGEGTASSGAWGNTCLNFTNTSGWALQTLSVQSGLGTTPFESPKFRDIAIYTPSSTSAGGCIRLNTILGGFTDNNTSQQPMLHPEVRNVLCYMGFITNNGAIGFQCSKCADGTIWHTDFYNGLNGIDLEGSDNINLDGGWRITNTYGSMVKFVSHGTFGNNDTIQNGQMLFVADTGAGQTVDSFFFDAARSSIIANVFFEGAAPAGGAITSQIHLSGGFSAAIHDNQMTASGTNWLLVDGIYNNITAINNGTYGGLVNKARFNNANYFFNGSGLQQSIVQYGNSQDMDSGWPYNTIPVHSLLHDNNVLAIFTPSVAGLTYQADGITEVPVDNAWTFVLTGPTHYLDWRTIIQGAAVTGTFDVGVFAYRVGGTANVACAVTDAGVVVAGYTAQAITATPTWYTIPINQAAATDAGIRCYTDTASARLIQVNLVKH